MTQKSLKCLEKLLLDFYPFFLRLKELPTLPHAGIAYFMAHIDRKAPDSDPEALAIGALVYIAGEPELFHRFLALTGLQPTEIRSAAREPGFLAGVLDFLMDHESILITYATSINRSPQDFVAARHQLAPISDI